MVLADNENFITFALMTDGTHLGLSVHTVKQWSRGHSVRGRRF